MAPQPKSIQSLRLRLHSGLRQSGGVGDAVIVSWGVAPGWYGAPLVLGWTSFGADGAGYGVGSAR